MNVALPVKRRVVSDGVTNQKPYNKFLINFVGSVFTGKVFTFGFFRTEPAPSSPNLYNNFREIL